MKNIMLDGDVIEFGPEDGRKSLTIDCSTVTVVMLGSYRSILTDLVLPGLEKSIGCRLGIEDAVVDALAAQAIQSRLGVRWMRSALQDAIDDAMFDTPGAEGYRITLRDGKLFCQAQSSREEVIARFYNEPVDRLPF